MTDRDQRLTIRIRGQVQGVGFRPFVYRSALRHGLSGFIRNDGAGVEIEAQGTPERLDAFQRDLRQPPPLARIDTVQVEAQQSRAGERGFEIVASTSSAVMTEITPDSAICPACLAELFDPTDRRYRYPFINCTDCGPRYTITTALPYDRPNTSMAGFTLCPACAQEYGDPGDRRFHAQPNACPVCGPRLTLRDADGEPVTVDDVIAATLQRLQAGEILAIKGLGGFHLVCDARNTATVERLRQRKQREAKPFAVMAANSASLAPWVEGSEEEWRLLETPQRPIVLMRQQLEAKADALPGIAQGLAHLGALLPYTPLHYLLFHEAAGRPMEMAWLERRQELVLVMTSANPGGEPLVIDDEEAVERLRNIADGFVTHDRSILVRCDDSVMTDQTFIRRARGYTPQVIRLPEAGPSVLALGGFLKNTLCLTRDDRAYLSPHIGSLDNAATCRALDEAVAHLQDILRIVPERVACDLHPDFHSSRLAASYAAERKLPRIAVQHHHAHIAAVAAEHGVQEPILGLALDGMGLGSDGDLWGGELLRVEGAYFERLGCLSPLLLPGGDRAAREPWRLAVAVLHRLGRNEEIPRRFGDRAVFIQRMLEQRIHTPETSSAGRLFDAVAALLGVREINAYEGQAAMELEALAHRCGPVPPWTDGFRISNDGALDLLPLLARLADAEEAGSGAALFHATLALALSEWLEWAGTASGLRRVALGGGCFLNRLLTGLLQTRLEAAGWSVLTAQQAPPNDGGLSLGQAWVALRTDLAPDSQ